VIVVESGVCQEEEEEEEEEDGLMWVLVLCRSSAQGNFSRRGSGDQSATTWSESTV
jgi:hypothetical protein